MTDDSNFANCPSDEEALKLVLAFYCIMEEDKRVQILALAERYALESKKAACDGGSIPCLVSDHQ